MSDRRFKAIGMRFEPVPENIGSAPGALVLIFAVLLPAAVIALELLSRMCARTFFDPLPTYWHALAAALVPASNLLLWLHLRNRSVAPIKWLAFGNGVGIAIAGAYALLFLPLLPLAIVGIIFLVGLLPLAPLASFICAIKLRRELSARTKEKTSRLALVTGVSAGLALLALLDIPGAATRLGIEWISSNDPSERARAYHAADIRRRRSAAATELRFGKLAYRHL